MKNRSYLEIFLFSCIIAAENKYQKINKIKSFNYSKLNIIVS